MRILHRALVGGIAVAIGASVAAQQPRDAAFAPTQAEVTALLSCEDAVLGKQNDGVRIRSGIYDRQFGQWLIVGEKRDQVVNCLVEQHGWTAQSTPDGRRVARAPR